MPITFYQIFLRILRVAPLQISCEINVGEQYCCYDGGGFVFGSRGNVGRRDDGWRGHPFRC